MPPEADHPGVLAGDGHRRLVGAAAGLNNGMTGIDQLEEGGARFVRVATVGDLLEARVLEARLRAEGIDVRIHSEALGPYPVTVGRLAEAELWVLSDRVEEASRILLDAEVNTALAPADPDAAQRLGMPVEMRMVALVVVLVLVALWFVRLARVI